MYFCGMESQRQKKIGGVLQKDLADILQRSASNSAAKGPRVSVSQVSVTPDLYIAKAYVSIYPPDRAAAVLKEIQTVQASIRYELARRTRNQLRRMPELLFFLDDSLEYIDRIEKSLKKGEDPIENPDLLPRRKKA